MTISPDLRRPLGDGVCKIRFAREGGGKSGGYWVIHFYGAGESTPIFLITVFAKHEKANLSKAETETVKALGKVLAETYRSKA